MPRRARQQSSPGRRGDAVRLRVAARLRARQERLAATSALDANPPRFGGWLTATPPVGDVPVIRASRPREPEGDGGRAPAHAAVASPERAGRLSRLTGLDGLRAIAVAAVLLYHADLDIAPGGFLGVDVFFVISGYLITALLLAEWAARGAISLGGFWFRRARRLLPAVFVLLVAVVLFALVALPDEVARIRADAAAAFAYATNWYLVFHDQSYFEAVGRPSPLGHLWSLALEEQFYLLWPPVLLALLVLVRRQGALLATLGLAWASAIWMAALFDPDADPSRIYFGTDTRMFALLIGAALAFVWVPEGKGFRHRSMTSALARLRGAVADAGAVAGLATLGVLFVTITAYDEMLYQGGFQFAALVTVLVIATVVRPGGLVGRVLDAPPIRWVGVRSYSIYLWHWPVFVMTRPGIDVPLDAMTSFAIRLAVTLVLADLSFRLVERPIREGAIGRTWRAWSGRQRSLGRDPRWSAVPAGLLTALLVVALGAQVLAARPAAAPSYLVGTEPASASEVSGDETAAAEPDTVDDPDLDVSGDPDSVDGGDPGADPNVDPNLNIGADDPLLDDDPSADPGPDGGVGPSADPSAAAADPSTPAGGPAPGTIGSPAAPALPGDGHTTASPAATSPPTGSGPTSAGPVASGTPGAPAPTADPAGPALPDPGASASPDGSAAPVSSPSTAEGPSSSAPARQPAAVATPRPTAKPAATPPAVARVSVRVLAIGDSVMLGAARELHRQFSSIEVNAAVSRQFSDGIRIVRARLAAGTLPDVVVIHLGTNGPISKRQFDQAMVALKGVELVVFVNVKVPRPWESYTNRTLSQNVGRYPNAVLVDWRGSSAGVDNAFARDGIHLNREGARAYARLIAAAIT